MKKLLLTLAAGVLILALPVIASAAGLGGNIFSQYFDHSVSHPQSIRPTGVGISAFDDYSGYTARITVRGFKSYSTSQGKNAGFKRFAWTERADKTLTGPKNTWAQMSTVNGGGTTGEVLVLLNAHTVLGILLGNAIAPANGNVIHANALYIIARTTGDLTLDSNLSLSTPASAGLTGAEDVMEGACSITASNNNATHNMVLSIRSATALADLTETYTSVSGTPDSWSQTGANYNWVTAPQADPSYPLRAVGVSPIMLKPTSDIGYSGPWWNLNSGGLMFF